MSESSCNVCDINEPLPKMKTFPNFHQRVMVAKTKQQMLDACAEFISFHGGFSSASELRNKLLGK